MDEQQIESDNKILLYDAAKEFLNSKVGKYLSRRAADQMQEGLIKFLDCDPTDIGKVTAIKLDMMVADAFPKWITEAIIEGQHELEMRLQEQGE